MTLIDRARHEPAIGAAALHVVVVLTARFAFGANVQQITALTAILGPVLGLVVRCLVTPVKEQ